jgi:ADP-ribose pyrophosphatase YjhB (NUDIX family)
MPDPESYVHYLRRQLGPRKILLAYATVILQDEYGRVLLQHRRDFDLWGLPGGVLELGEDLQGCARRELQEETGLLAGELALVGVYSEPEFDFTYPNGDQVQQFTVCVAGPRRGGQMQADGVESSRQAFFETREIPWGELTPWYRAMLRDYLSGDDPACPPPVSQPVVEPQIQSMRAHLGSQPLIAPGVVVAVCDAAGRLLMVQRRDDHGWSMPGGFCDIGENAPQTARRELLEETGLLAEPQRLLGIYAPGEIHIYPNGDQVQPCIAAYRMQVTGGALQQHSAETTRAAWLEPDEIRRLEAPELVRQVHAAVLEHLQGGSFLKP